jgi:hypothetical protein
MSDVGFSFPTTPPYIGTAPGPPPPPADTGSNWWTGLTNLFGSIAQDVAGVWRAVEGTSPPPQPVYGQPSGTVRQQPADGTGTSLTMLLLLGAVLYLALRK